MTDDANDDMNDMTDTPELDTDPAATDLLATDLLATDLLATDVAEADEPDTDGTDAVDVAFDLTVDADAGDAADEAEDEVDIDDPWTRPGAWYVVHTQSGYEKKVTANLGARIQSMNMEDRIYEVVIPMEEVEEF